MNTLAEHPHSILDEMRNQFPLDLDIHIPKIRDLYRLATAKQWNPRTDIDWDAFDPTLYTDEQRYAARQYWSRRAWSEYGAISESPALQMRFCHDNCAADLRLFFRSEEHTSELQSLMRISYAVFCLKKKKN